MPQGQELSLLERVTHIAMRVHHTKWTITHTHAGIYIYIYTYIHHAQCHHTEQESKTDIVNVPKVWPSKVQEIWNKHFHTQGMRPKQGARKIKGTRNGGNLMHCSREDTVREGERCNHSRRLGLLIYWTLPFVGLSSCLHPCPFCLRLGGWDRKSVV